MMLAILRVKTGGGGWGGGEGGVGRLCDREDHELWGLFRVKPNPQALNPKPQNLTPNHCRVSG